MHEVSVVSNMVEAILKELEKYDVERVEEVNVLIGDLTSLGAEQLEFAYEIVTRGTILEGSRFVIEREEVRVRCTECGYGGPADTLESDFMDHSVSVIACPKCGGHVEITAGQACRVRDLNIVEADRCSN
ncbi:MAG: hydrogenase maturation nickel metallochaperone HypA [Candidatus Methanomethylophilaceae archaeon]|nr:hydrogenase maturation nickel metallochaperone HypA [Candidatus Methanomethylophilaceae archaeon]